MQPESPQLSTPRSCGRWHAQGGGAVVADQSAEEADRDRKVVSHGRHVAFQMAEVVVSGQMFNEILMLIARLRAPSAPA
jgi:hypothetical protein